MIDITQNLSISDDEISFDFTLASGPGGQHVNKTETAVKLRFDAANSPSLSKTVFRRLKAIAGRLLTNDGVLVIDSRTHRSRELNRKEALERLKTLLAKATVKPKPRRKTKPTLASKERRLKEKKSRGQIKVNRGRANHDD